MAVSHGLEGHSRLVLHNIMKHKLPFRTVTFKTLTSPTFSHLKSIYNMFVCLLVCLMVFNATINNISFISCQSWWPVLLVVEETGGKPPTCRKSNILKKINKYNK